MWYCEAGSAKGDFPDLVGSIGELTAVASAKRAVRGDFNEPVVLIDNVLVVAGMDVEESSEADRARTAYCIFGL